MGIGFGDVSPKSKLAVDVIDHNRKVGGEWDAFIHRHEYHERVRAHEGNGFVAIFNSVELGNVHSPISSVPSMGETPAFLHSVETFMAAAAKECFPRKPRPVSLCRREPVA